MDTNMKAGWRKRPVRPEGHELEVPEGEITKLATATTQMARQLRQIKILIVIFAVASLSISVGSTVYFAKPPSLLDEHGHEPEASEAAASDDEARSVGPSENDPLPPINLPDADGIVWKNRDLAGKAVLLNFWATWCGPCRREMPVFDEMQKEYESKGFTVLAVSLDRDGWDSVRPYIAELKPSYPVFVADKSVEREFGRITLLPTTYFVRRDGTINTKHVGGLSKSRIVRHIESLLEGGSENGANAAVAEHPSSSEREETADSSARLRNERSSRDTGLPERADEVGIGSSDEYSPPKILDFVSPEFPDEAGNETLEGSIEVEFQIRRDGSANDIKVVRGLGMALDERVVEAVRQSRFEPAKKSGKPVSAKMKLRFRRNVNQVARPPDHEQ